MRALIQSDGPSPALRRHRRDDPEAVRRILVHEGHRPFTIGAHGKAAAWVERGTIDATPDRQRNQHPAAIRIHDRHQPVGAHRKQAARPAVDRQPRRLLARRERPTAFHRQRLRIERHELALVLDIDVHVSAPIRHRVLRLAPEVQRAHDGSGLRIDRGRISPAAIECEHATREGIIGDRIRIAAGDPHHRERRERLEIEDRHGGVAAVAREAPIQLADERNAVHAVGVGDIADH